MSTDNSKILIVDDNTFYLTLLKTILKDVEVSVFLANSGEEALSLISENDFALAILDIEMPVMDGFDLARRIRNIKDRDLLPIIFLTAYFSDELSMFKGYESGAIDFLTKPVNKNIFISKVKIFLEFDRQKINLIESKKSIEKSKLELEHQQQEIKLQNVALKNAQSESELSRKKYRKLYDFAPTSYFTIFRDGQILETNFKGAQMFGEDQVDLAGRNIKEFIASSMIIDFDEFLTQIFEHQTPTVCELKLNQIQGKDIFVLQEGALIDDDQKCLLSMVDITERNEAQKALKASEELYYSILKTSPDGIIVTDLNGKITEASNMALELFGVKNTDIVGMQFLQFVPKKSKRAMYSLYQTTILEEKVHNFEIILNRQDKTEFPGEISSSLIKGNNGTTSSFMVVIRDISERILFEKQLRHSERMSGIGELATGMAHEINQPLNTISLSLDNVMFSLENNTCNENYLKTKINKVFDNITRIKKIIDHVRTFSRDQDDLIKENFEINASIQNSISMISEQFSNKEISLDFYPDDNIPTFIGNTYRFEQVILNMLINAKDALDEKRKQNCSKFKKRIDITTKLLQKQAIIEIKDNGIGIDPEYLDKVLLPFFTTKAPGQGTGLGLSISYGIIKELDGEINIQSKPKLGTTIQIKLPIQNLRNKKLPINHVHQ